MITTERVLLATTVDPDAQLTVAGALALELPDTVVVRYAAPGPDRAGLRRTVSDAAGLVYDDLVELDHDCVSCTVRGDLAGTVRTLADRRRWRHVVVCPPATSTPEPLVAALSAELADQPGAPALGPVLGFVAHATAADDLLGDDLLDERGLALAPTDRRSVGEALLAQLDGADLIVGLDEPARAAGDLLDHVTDPRSGRIDHWSDLSAAVLAEHDHDPRRARRRRDLMAVRPSGAADTAHAWTLDLTSDRPLAPEPLLEHLDALGGGRLIGRGHFWLASRPTQACAWEGAGGQVGVGRLGSWRDTAPGTRIVVSGDDPADRSRVREAFSLIVRRSRGATARWRDDGLDPWLGPIDRVLRTA